MHIKKLGAKIGLLSIPLLSPFSGSLQAQFVEDQVLKCHIQRMGEMDYVLEDYEPFEDILIEEGLLEGNKPMHYYQFWKKASEVEIPLINLKEGFHFPIFQGFTGACLEDTLAVEKSESPYFRVKKAFQLYLDTTSHFKFQELAKTVVENILEEEFTHPVFRVLSLKLIFHLNSEIQFEGIPHKAEEKLNYDTLMLVVLNEQDEVYLNGELSSSTAVQKEVKGLIRAYPQTYLIVVQNSIGCTYDFYVKNIDTIKQVLNGLRNEKAIEIYGKGFDFLEEDQKKEIRKALPFRLTEGVHE